MRGWFLVCCCSRLFLDFHCCSKRFFNLSFSLKSVSLLVVRHHTLHSFTSSWTNGLDVNIPNHVLYLWSVTVLSSFVVSVWLALIFLLNWLMSSSQNVRHLSIGVLRILRATGNFESLEIARIWLRYFVWSLVSPSRLVWFRVVWNEHFVDLYGFILTLSFISISVPLFESLFGLNF